MAASSGSGSGDVLAAGDVSAVESSERRNEDHNGEVVQGDAVETANQEQGGEGQQDNRFSFFAVAKGLMMRAVVIYFITSLFRGSSTPPEGVPGTTNEARRPSTNMFPNGTEMDLYIYLSESETFNEFNNSKSLVWFEDGLVYGDWHNGPNGDGTYNTNLQIDASENVQNNGSLYLHIYFVRSGKSPDPTMKGSYSRKYTVHKTKRLTKFKKRIVKIQRLLMGDQPPIEETKPAHPTEPIAHWHPNLTINIVSDHTQWVQGSVPPPLDEYVEFEPATGKYFPIVYLNDYWNLQRDYMPVNDTTKVLNLSLTYQPLSLFRWQMYTAQSMRSRWTSSLLGDTNEESDEEQDSIKEAFIETNPYLLGITVIVSVFHTVFELLAFKNDIQFWKNRSSLEGLSVRLVFFNVFQSMIVLLYVLDNETNTLVRISMFVGLGIDIWKIHKVINIDVNREERIFGFIPRIRFSDKGSYVQSSTKVYDQLAFKYLSWCLFPLLAGYSVYSVLYQEHKGWYSWVLSMLYGFLLTFGFIMMTPQLFINYKMKTVAHMPWRMMTYKALNTFIDDIFAFVIKMPTMYRIGCFRDDIVFFIFLYQRWIYRVDPTRVNEFGTSAVMEQQLANGDLRPIGGGDSECSDLQVLPPSDKKND